MTRRLSSRFPIIPVGRDRIFGDLSYQFFTIQRLFHDSGVKFRFRGHRLRIPFYTAVVSELSPASSTLDSAKNTAPLRVVSVSLGSTRRDHIAQAQLLGRDWILERRGTNGDLKKARQLIAELDGQVAAIGLGGIDLHINAGGKQYTLRDAAKLASAAKITPIVDGAGLKDTLERATIQKLQNSGLVNFTGAKVMLCMAVDRFGMAEELIKLGADATFGDMLFALGISYPIKDLKTVRRLGSLILPIATQLPFPWLYPVGEKQNQQVENRKFWKLYEPAEIIAGDFLYIRRYAPPRLDGKTILTNTVTPSDIDFLRERGARRLITTTPEFDGRSFGTNVMEGIFAAMGAKTPEDYRGLLAQLNWEPRVVELQS